MSKAGIEYPPRDWDRIERLGLVPGVSSPEAYSKQVAIGMRIASATLSLKGEVVPSQDTIKGLHFLAFESVHPWAGVYRKPGQEVSAGVLICSDAKDIPRELASLEKEMLDNPLKGTRKYLSEVLGFHHASFLAIHPFLDGNGRLSRVMLDHQCKKLLGHPLTQNYSRAEYIEALSRAQQEGDISKLAKIIGSRSPDRAIMVQVPNKIVEEPKRTPSLSELRAREKELIKLRRKLGFAGTEIEAHYGVGGFPPPLTEKSAAAKAQNLKLGEEYGSIGTKDLVLELLAEDKAINQARDKVSRELITVRAQLTKAGREVGLVGHRKKR